MKFNWFGLLLNLIIGFVIYGGILLFIGDGILTYIFLTLCISVNLMTLVVKVLQDKGYLYKEQTYDYEDESEEFDSNDYIACKIGEWITK